MNVYIELDRRDGIIFWVADDETGKNVRNPNGDPHNLNSINQDAELGLWKILEIIDGANLGDNGISTQVYVDLLSRQLEDLKPAIFQIFKTESVIRIPESLRSILHIEEEILTLTEWLSRYPAKNKTNYQALLNNNLRNRSCR